MDPASLLRTIYITSAAGIVAINSVPFLRDRFIPYGSRSSETKGKESEIQSKDSKRPAITTLSKFTTWTTACLDVVSSMQLPHSWFIHFYIVSTISSLSWATQVYRNAPLVQSLAARSTQTISSSMTVEQIVLVWFLMLLQGARRLYECIVFTKPSQSRMWIAHWAIGIGFYLAMGMTVWIEGSPTLLVTKLSSSSLVVRTPSMRTFVGLQLFLLASGLQHDCHRHLASLKKYSLPTSSIFQSIVCPHYFAECLIYLSLAIIGAPRGSTFNKTVVSALVFIAGNLGVTAASSRKWYAQKFGEDSIKDKWNMIPFVW